MSGLLSDAEYDARVLRRLDRDTGRTTMPSWDEQLRAIGGAARQAGDLASEILLPQSPIDLALMALFGPGGRAARILLGGGLAALEASRAEANPLSRGARAVAEGAARAGAARVGTAAVESTAESAGREMVRGARRRNRAIGVEDSSAQAELPRQAGAAEPPAATPPGSAREAPTTQPAPAGPPERVGAATEVDLLATQTSPPPVEMRAPDVPEVSPLPPSRPEPPTSATVTGPADARIPRQVPRDRPSPTQGPTLTRAELEEGQRLQRRLDDGYLEDRASGHPIQPRPEDRVLADPNPARWLDVPQTIGSDLDALRVGTIAPGRHWPHFDPDTGRGSLLDLMPYREELVRRVSALMARRPNTLAGQFFNMMPSHDWLRAHGRSANAAREQIDDLAHALAGTSPAANAVLNLRGASLALRRRAAGEGLDAQSLREALRSDSIRVLIPGLHGPLTQRLFDGAATLGGQTKVLAMDAALRGDRSLGIVDRHVVRGFNMIFDRIAPGALPRASFNSSESFRIYNNIYDAIRRGERGRVEVAELRPLLATGPARQSVGGQMLPTEYQFYNDLLQDVGRTLNLSPAETQAQFRSMLGGRTGLRSHHPTQTNVMNDRFSISSQIVGRRPDEIADYFFRGMIAIPAAAGVVGTNGLLNGGQEPQAPDRLL